MYSVIMNMLYWNLLMNLTVTTIPSVYNETKTTLDSHDSTTSIEALVTGATTIQPQNGTSMMAGANIQTERSSTTLTPLENEEVCYLIYGEEVCFSLGGLWSAKRSRPIVQTPSHPDNISTTFHIHSRRGSFKILEPDDLDALKNLTIDDKQIFKIIVHGFRSSKRVFWVKNMVDEFLRADDDIVIVIDWHKGSLISYAQAAANIRVVGAQVASLIHQLVTNHGSALSSFHLIGHSLGSHLLGHCGHRLKHTYNMIIPRITALDPAGPFYKDAHPSTRLDPSDADFVDVIHTDNDDLFGFPLSVGLTSPIGHLDYYPNGGISQPKCSYGSIQCQHQRAIQLFTESIRQSCTFIGVVCESYELFLQGGCWGCDDGNTCSPMGMKAAPLPARPTMTKLFIATYGHSPYCGTQYRITVRIRNESSSVDHEGEFAIIGVELKSARESTGEILMSEKSLFYTAGEEHQKVVLTNRVGALRSIIVSFHYPGSIFNPMSWRIKSPVLHLHSIVIEELLPSQRWKFCFHEQHLTPYLKYKLTAEHWC